MNERWDYKGLLIQFVDGYELVFYMWRCPNRTGKWVMLKDVYRLYALGAGSQ